MNWTNQIWIGIVLLSIAPQDLGTSSVPMEIHFHSPLPDDEPDNEKLTYCTYTKRHPTITNNAGIKTGKIYIGRTSGYSKYPEYLIRLRDYSHHKSPTYANACYDDHMYSLNDNWYKRHDDVAYLTIRGREQNVIESMGGAWSSFIKDPERNYKFTRSGNEINGIAKRTPSQLKFYNICMQLTKAKPIPPTPADTWTGSCQ